MYRGSVMRFWVVILMEVWPAKEKDVWVLAEYRGLRVVDVVGGGRSMVV